MAQDSSKHVGLVGRLAGTVTLAKAPWLYRFGKHGLLMSAILPEINRFLHRAIFVGDHAFVIVLKFARFQEILMQSSLVLSGIEVFTTRNSLGAAKTWVSTVSERLHLCS